MNLYLYDISLISLIVCPISFAYPGSKCLTQKQWGRVEITLDLYHIPVYIQSQTLALGKPMIHLFLKDLFKTKNLGKTLNGWN